MSINFLPKPAILLKDFIAKFISLAIFATYSKKDLHENKNLNTIQYFKYGLSKSVDFNVHSNALLNSAFFFSEHIRRWM